MLDTTAQALLSALVADGKISQSQADEVATESLGSGKAVDEILTAKRIVSDIDLARGRAKAYNIPFVTLLGRAFAPDVLNLIPEPVARRYTLLPFSFDPATSELSVAMIDPLDFQ